jgi:hypothetical protein
MHLEPEQIQRWLHGELEASSQEAVGRHVATCPECRSRLDQARQEEDEIVGLLHHVDHAVPQISAAAVVARAHGAKQAQEHRGAPAKPARSAPHARRRPWLGGWQRRAAAVVVAIACGGAAYALPGSPLPGWIERVAGWVEGPDPEPGARRVAGVERPAPIPPTPPPATAGIAAAPGERFVIRFVATQSVGAVTVTLIDGPEIVVQARSGAATFTTQAGGLLIDNAGSTADYQIELPRAAPWVEIQLQDRRLFLKDGARQVASIPADPAGRFVLTLAPGGR